MLTYVCNWLGMPIVVIKWHARLLFVNMFNIYQYTVYCEYAYKTGAYLEHATVDSNMIILVPINQYG